MRRCRLAIVFLGFLVLMTGNAGAVNLLGDANNSGTIEIADARLAQDFLYGKVGPDQVSPLALADGDSDIDLADLMWVGQAAKSQAVINGPGALLSITHASDPTLADGAPDTPVVFDIASNYPTATMVDGLEVSVSMLPGESILSGASTVVASNQANATFTPINASAPDDIYSIDTQIVVRNSDDNSTVHTALDTMTVIVRPVVCGDGFVDGSEVCDIAIHDCCGLDCTPFSMFGVGCRPATGDCDPEESCDGISGLCPTDAFQAENTPCSDCPGGFCSVCANGVCLADPSCVCGDLVIDPSCGEVCEDGNSVDCDGCSADCLTLEFGCGDGALCAFEDCDDRNNANGDGCEGNCLNACTPLPCRSGDTEQYFGGEDSWPGGFDPGGWTVFSNAVFNGGQARRATSASQIFEGSFTTQSVQTRFYVWVLGRRVTTAPQDHTKTISIDGVQIGEWDGLWSGGVNGPQWQKVGEVVLPPGAHIMSIQPKANFTQYFDGWGITTNPVLDPQNQFMPLATYNLDNPTSDFFLPGSSIAECCGDCVIRPGEACDAGDATTIYNGCTVECSIAYCGDGIVQFGEVCDDGSGEGEGLCLDDCSSIQTCGDGILEGTETCDEGTSNGTCGYCDALCQAPFPSCGNGIVECSEYCDDGAANGREGNCNSSCSLLCREEIAWAQMFDEMGGLYLAVDTSNGWLYGAGSHYFTATVGPYTLPGSGSRDIALVKMDYSGNVLEVWGFGSGGNDSVHQLKIDSQGNAIMMGAWGGNSPFGSLTAEMGEFIVKIDPNGNPLWIYQCVPTAGECFMYGMDLDDFDRIQVMGHYSGSVLWGGVPLFTAGPESLWLGQLDSNGEGVWNWTANATNGVNGIAIKTDNRNQSWALGSFDSAFLLDTTLVDSPSGDGNFVSLLSSSGNVQWASAIGAGIGSSYDLATHIDGNATLAGRVTNEVVLNGAVLPNPDWSTLGEYNYFVSNLQASDGAFGNQTLFLQPGDERIIEVISDRRGLVMIYGRFTEEMGTGTETLSSLGGFDDYILQVDPGTMQRRIGWRLGGTEDQHAKSICADSGKIFAAGMSAGTLDLGSIQLNAGSLSDAYLLALDHSTLHLDCSPCGNGQMDPGEVCDDGDQDNCTTACNDSCSGPGNLCGDGWVECGESCDDANTASGDGCDANCLNECGNGILDPGEICDDGYADQCGSCDSHCDALGFGLGSCGDGLICPENGESCDQGPLNGAGPGFCMTDCSGIQP